jgi:rare lipoprotein A (peptidoglycan hydrolase)
MKRRTKLLLVAVLGLQLYCTPLMIAEPTTGIGSDAISQDQTTLIMESVHAQEPPGIYAVVDTMVATYYSRCFNNRRTSNGEKYNRLEFTCAHKTLPFNTLLKVTNPKNNKSVIVRVNDRGPFRRHRQLDLSYAAAKEIGMLREGVLPLQVQIIPNDSLNAKLVEN